MNTQLVTAFEERGVSHRSASSGCRFLVPELPKLEDVLEVYGTAYNSGLITNSSIVERFERAAAERLGVPHCVAVSSCTAGLMLVARALGLTGKVIIPSFTFFATAHAFRWNGLQIGFADCHPDSWNIDPASVERMMTDDVSAIVGVHMYGNPCDTDALTALATKHKVKLIFDAAHGFGSTRDGRAVGTFGDAEVFSLSPTKTVIAGEGGLVCTHDATLARRLIAARNYGDHGAYDPELTGLSARMPEFNAAVALTSLRMLDMKVRTRNQIAESYTAGLSGITGMRFQQIRPEDASTCKDYSFHVDPETFPVTREEVASRLLEAGIETKRYFWPPVHLQRLYRDQWQACCSPLPVTEYISGGIVSLPIYESLPDSVIARILSVVRRMAAPCARPVESVREYRPA